MNDSDRATPKNSEKSLAQCRLLDSVTKVSKRLRISNIMQTCGRRKELPRRSTTHAHCPKRVFWTATENTVSC